MPAEVRTRTPTVLSTAELEAFARDGYVRLDCAFDADLGQRIQDRIWSELSDAHRIQRDERPSWRTPPSSPQRTKVSRLANEITTPRFDGAISDLLGRDDWRRPKHWGGFLITFPSGTPDSWDVPTDGWHWDGPPFGDGLLVFTFYGDVGPRGGGTLIVKGSHRVIAEFYASLPQRLRQRPHAEHRKRLRTFDPWLATLSGAAESPPDRIDGFMARASEVRGVECQVIELTGKPGDAVLCDPGILHSASRCCGDFPRFMRTKFLLET